MKKAALILVSLALLFTAAVTAFYSDNFVSSFGLLHGVTQGKTTAKLVALTFDDGPNPGYTENILSLLDKHKAKATFFTLGRNLQNHRKTAMKLVASGHQLGNHGCSHQVLSELDLSRQKEEILATEAILKELGVAGPIPFRPPYGHMGLKLRSWLQSTNRELVLWSPGAYAPDYFRHDPRRLVNQWIKSIQPGAILLLHDGEGIRSETVEALKWLLEYMDREGYRSITIQELLKG